MTSRFAWLVQTGARRSSGSQIRASLLRSGRAASALSSSSRTTPGWQSRPNTCRMTLARRPGHWSSDGGIFWSTAVADADAIVYPIAAPLDNVESDAARRTGSRRDDLVARAVAAVFDDIEV